MARPHPSWCHQQACASRNGVPEHRSRPDTFGSAAGGHYRVELVQRGEDPVRVALTSPHTSGAAKAGGVELSVPDVAVVEAMLRSAVTRAHDSTDAVRQPPPEPGSAPAAEDVQTWVTGREASKIAGISYATVVRAMNAGQLHAHRVGSSGARRLWRVRPQCVTAWIEGHSPDAVRTLCGCDEAAAPGST